MSRRGVYQHPGARKPNNVWSNSGGGSKYYDHDDFDNQGSGSHSGGSGGRQHKDNGRRVSFKPSGIGGSAASRLGLVANLKTAEMAIRSRLAEDEDMNGGGGGSAGEFGESSGQRNRQKQSQQRRFRRGSPIPQRNQNGGGGGGGGVRKKLMVTTNGWYMVTIPFGHKHDKQLILKQLQQLVAPLVFIPHYFKTELTCIQFFVDDLNVAETLHNSDRKLSFPDGFKMVIKVRHAVPQVNIDASLREKMKLAMAKRYTAATKALDLSKFHADPELQDIFCALFRPPIFMAAVEVISENIPDLEALKLDDNKLFVLDHMKCLAQKLPFLKILHLANNKISSMNALESLKELVLVDLVLDNNPVKTRARDPEYFVSEIRKKFPKLMRLDNVDLPPMIGFDLADELKLPAPKASFLCNLAGADIVRQFLEQYFIIFDSASRQPLLNAYDEHAMFSMTAGLSQNNLRLTAYQPHSRNIMRMREAEQRNKLLKNGRLPVVSFLSELPPTQHDPLSFAVDLTLFTPQLIQLTVSGVFRERPKESGSPTLRAFQKALTIVPSGAGFCIKNELLHVSNCTMMQVRAAFKAPAAAVPVAGAAAPVATVAAGAAVGQPQQPDEATKMQMVQAMSQHSNMNLEWSRKCLEETNWNFERAGYTFTELHKQNKIPPEAFVK